MSEKTNYKVYVHIAPNGKRYYGITKQKVEARWKNGKGYGANEYFYRAINKYGWDNFEHIVIARGLSEEEAKWLEVELIREHDTSNREYGYNISLGGEAHKGKKHPRATKVYCVELDMYFETIIEASEYISRDKSNISSVLRGKQKTAGGYHWIYAEDRDKVNKRLNN